MANDPNAPPVALTTHYLHCSEVALPLYRRNMLHHVMEQVYTNLSPDPDAHDLGGERAGMTYANNQLVYRLKVSPEDVDKCPILREVAEVWITSNLGDMQ